ncbi:putative outer membrane lipoprotein [Oryzomicrobium terrae]|uniref:Outer membrane protein assembly factor BamE n=1 Tax=Oryzomicrobium terrae TaxID=1735038 RepID=A0A5C1E8K3_9RHOO|nr:outer membrane protein assembly factor BamE [Oryzomicrobium terrae]QEL64558.1 putative outer membrane lipoprotein [Oryzomicrobium terrae]
MSRHLLSGLCVLSVVALAACSPPKLITEYRIDVQQGNALTQDQVAQLRPGLSKDQVRYILGTALLADAFHADRWDYVYRLQKGSTREIESRRLTIFFQDGKLTRVAGDVVPAKDGQAVGDAGVDAPEEKTRVIDLGSLPADGKPLPPVENERGFFGRMLEKVGL